MIGLQFSKTISEMLKIHCKVLFTDTGDTFDFYIK